MPEQIPNLRPVPSPFDENFFKEIERRSYRGARKAIFQAMLLSTLTVVIFWAAFAAVVYIYVLPVATQFINKSIPKIPTTEDVLKQIDELQNLYSK